MDKTKQKHAAKLYAAAVELRSAAFTFVKLRKPKDAKDTEGSLANRRLLRAAIHYAKAKAKMQGRTDSPRTDQ